jgi:predicted transcriptional regulator
MQTRLLIDAIVRQTTVLIAQLSTTAGIRAPLAHVADQIFVDLVNAIEAQGVGRKVVADMFGLALRTYQKKVQRLTESVTARDRTLWEAVLDFIQTQGSATRTRILERFRHDDEDSLAAVLNDLVHSGVVYKTGQGSNTLYGMTSKEDYRQLLDQDQQDSVSALAWVLIYREGTCSKEELLKKIRTEAAVLDKALEELLREGRVQREEGPEERYRAGSFVVPVGAESGWEAAVFDHYQAVVTAISAKLAVAPGKSRHNDTIGGATLSFDVHAGHPFEAQVYEQLKTVRAQANALWQQVAAHNKANPIPDEQKVKVTFYFGQSVVEAGEHEGKVAAAEEDDA